MPEEGFLYQYKGNDIMDGGDPEVKRKLDSIEIVHRCTGLFKTKHFYFIIRGHNFAVKYYTNSNAKT